MIGLILLFRYYYLTILLHSSAGGKAHFIRMTASARLKLILHITDVMIWFGVIKHYVIDYDGANCIKIAKKRTKMNCSVGLSTRDFVKLKLYQRNGIETTTMHRSI